MIELEKATLLRETKYTDIDHFKVYYENKKAAEQTIDYIFNTTPYLFQTSNVSPFIIDAGSGIGVSTLYFKKTHPQSTIVCFEPDPAAYSLLQKNIEYNHLSDVTAMKYAIAGKAGIVDFFGQVDVPAPDTRGNSLMAQWANQQAQMGVTSVAAVKLSAYIDDHREVDFLKLDIGACEQEVLTELVLANKLCMIKEMVIEIHHIFRLKDCNHAATIFSLLRRNNFELTLDERSAHFLYTGKTKEWARNLKPRLLTLRACRM